MKIKIFLIFLSIFVLRSDGRSFLLEELIAKKEISLTSEEKSEISDAFSLFDKNKDGQISIEELGETTRAAGQKYSQDDLKNMIRAIDKNGNGKVEFKEFLQMMAKTIKDRNRMNDSKLFKVKKIFSHFDKNGDKRISAKELGDIMRFIGRNFSDAQIRELLKKADDNKNGTIEFDEFLKIVDKYA